MNDRPSYTVADYAACAQQGMSIGETAQHLRVSPKTVQRMSEYHGLSFRGQRGPREPRTPIEKMKRMAAAENAAVRRATVWQ